MSNYLLITFSACLMPCMQRKLLFLITVIIEYLESLCIVLNKILVGLTYQLFRSIRSRHSGFSIDAFLHQIPLQGNQRMHLCTMSCATPVANQGLVSRLLNMSINARWKNKTFPCSVCIITFTLSDICVIYVDSIYPFKYIQYINVQMWFFYVCQ